MADDYGPGTFFPEVFQNGVPDIQPALLDLVQAANACVATRPT